MIKRLKMKKIYLKKCIYLIILCVVLIIAMKVFIRYANFDIAGSTKNNLSNNLPTEQRVIQAVEKAYYNRGLYGQYCTYRRAFINPPENATQQHTAYTVCSNFAFNVYYEAFQIQVPSITQLINQYAWQFYDDDNPLNDVVEYWERVDGVIVDRNAQSTGINLDTYAGQQAYAHKLLTDYNLQIGDILCYGNITNGAGHTMIVYDIEYDESNNPVEAVLMDAESKGDDNKTTKLTAEALLYRNMNNHGVTEGVIRKRYLTKKYEYNSEQYINSVVYLLSGTVDHPREYLAILRPLLKDANGNYTHKYYSTTYSSDTSPEHRYTGYKFDSRNEENYSITSSALQRINYPDLYIEKTVDVFNNTVVQLGDILEYKVELRNNSQTDYNTLQIIETLGDNVEFVEASGSPKRDGNKIIWTENILAGKRRERSYKVRVKEDYSLLGTEINSQGTVAAVEKDSSTNQYTILSEISSGTITNYIGNNLSSEEKTSIKNNLRTLLSQTNKLKGEKLVDRIYSDLGYDFKLGEDTSNNQAAFEITDLIKTKATTVYTPEEPGNRPAVYLNSNNDKYGLVLSNHYSAVYNKTNENNVVTSVSLKRWEAQSKLGSRDKRADTLYMQSFQTGDVLVYKNSQTAVSGKDYLTESGQYYLIFISEEDKITVNGNEIYGFIGVNSDGSINNIYGNDSDQFTIHDLRTLFGKDYYVIFRPSLGVDITPPDVEVSYTPNTYTSGNVVVNIVANEEIQSVQGWELSTDGKTLSKVYTENAVDSVTINDLAGNEKVVNITVDKIISNVKGDVNENNQLDLGDLTLLYKHLAQNNSTETAQKYPDWKLSDAQVTQGDFNNNNRIDIGDCLRIQRYISASNSEEVAQRHPEWLIFD